jgi:hypothetical protein
MGIMLKQLQMHKILLILKCFAVVDRWNLAELNVGQVAFMFRMNGILMMILN